MEAIDENQRIFNEFDRKIKDDRIIIRKTNQAQTFGWVLAILGVVLIFLLPGLWWILGVLVSLGSALCIYSAIKIQNKAEQNLRQYQTQKAELIDDMMKRKDLWD